MDPTFSDIDHTEFKSVVQFFHAGEYEPILLHCADGKFALDESIALIKYSNDLLRSANLFNLAKRFQLPALAYLVFNKVLRGHYNKYGRQSF
jgi:hypothetical protein